MEHLVHNAAFQDHAPAKVETGWTWDRLMKELRARQDTCLEKRRLPKDTPFVMVTPPYPWYPGDHNP